MLFLGNSGIKDWAVYYIGFIISFFKNIWVFIKNIWEAFVTFFVRNAHTYLTTFVNSTLDFGFLDWACYTFVFLVNVAFLFLVVLRIRQIHKRRRRYKVKKVEKEELLDEIENLNYKIEELIQEKSQILGMKVNAGKTFSSLLNNNQKPEDSTDNKKTTVLRFPKLSMVDTKYENEITSINMGSNDYLNLPQLVEKFINFSASQLHLFYDEKTICAFIASLASSKIIILQGVSGTGKTSLPYAMGKFFGNNSVICSVQPSWRDRQELLGYLNEFTKKFNETDFLKALYETTYREDINLIVLDEMNLARIEYYFAEFLSVMEMPDPSEWKIDLVPETMPNDPRNLINGKVPVPQNVWFVGTANKDDSTFTITDKVYDRASIIEMNARAKPIDAPYTDGVTMSYEYLNSMLEKAKSEFALDTKMLDNITKIDNFILANFKTTFGNRIMKQLKDFVPVFVACGESEIAGIDYFICRKVLRKFESLNLSFLHDELNSLISLLDKTFGKNQCIECINYIKYLIKNS